MSIQSGALFSGYGTVYGNLSNLNTSQVGQPLLGAGTLNISGNYSQGTAALLEMRLFGPGNADRLAVSGSASPAGTLKVDLENGYLPTSGNSFILLYYMSHSGQFGALNLAPLNSGSWHWSYNSPSYEFLLWDQ